MTADESRYQHDQRIRAEEARLQRMEAATQANRELLEDVKKEFHQLTEELRHHATEDTERFASVDSRLMGIQSQLSALSTQLTTQGENANTVLANSRKLQKLEETVYTREGLSRVEVLWMERRDSETRLGVVKRQAALLGGGVGIGATLFGVLTKVMG